MTNSSDKPFNSFLGNDDGPNLVLNEEDRLSVEDVYKYLKGIKAVEANKA